MKKRHLAKRPLRFEALEARLNDVRHGGPATACGHPSATGCRCAVPAALLSSEKAALAFLSSEKAASPVAGKPQSSSTTTTTRGCWAGVEVDDLANSQEGSAGDAAQAVQATWNVPTIVPTTLSYEIVSNWVGIGGGHLSLSDEVPSNLVQIGTYEQTYNAIPNYAAFWEVYGVSAYTGGSMTIGAMWISPGDQISAQVTPLGSHMYSLQITDVTKQILTGVLNQVYHNNLPAALYTFSTTLSGVTGVVVAPRRLPAPETITAEAPNFAQYPLPYFVPVVAQAYVQTNPSFWAAFGGLPGYLVDDIISNDPNNTSFGTRTYTLGFPIPGYAYIITIFIDSN